jgi:hypothetical protein
MRHYRPSLSWALIGAALAFLLAFTAMAQSPQGAGNPLIPTTLQTACGSPQQPWATVTVGKPVQFGGIAITYQGQPQPLTWRVKYATTVTFDLATRKMVTTPRASIDSVTGVFTAFRAGYNLVQATALLNNRPMNTVFCLRAITGPVT